MKKPTRTPALATMQQWLYWSTLAGIAIFHISTLRSGHYWGGDFSQYIHHAKNLAEGKPYNDILYIVNSFASVSPANYPPVFPLILAPVYEIWGLNLMAMKLVMVAFYISALVVLKKVFQHRLLPLSMFALLLIVGLNPYFWQFKDRILSDIPYLLFSLCSLYLMRLNDTERRLGISVLLGIFMYLAYGTREIGLVLPLTLISYELWRHRKLTRGSLVAITLFIVLSGTQWLAMQFDPVYPEIVLQHGAIETTENVSAIKGISPARNISPSNLDYVQSNPSKILAQINRYPEGLYTFWKINGLAFEKPFFWLLNGLALVGFVSALTRGTRVTEIYFFGYLCTLALYGGRDFSRYLLPLLPIYVFYILTAVSQLKYIHRYLQYFSLLILAILISSVYLDFYTNQDYSERDRGITAQPAKELFEFLRTQTQPTDVLVARKPRVFSLLTQRAASAYPNHSKRPKRQMQYFHAINARYLITQPKAIKKKRNGQIIVNSLIKKYPDDLSLIFRNRQFNVYVLSP